MALQIETRHLAFLVFIIARWASEGFLIYLNLTAMPIARCAALKERAGVWFGAHMPKRGIAGILQV
jgi:hypothetical protein